MKIYVDDIIIKSPCMSYYTGDLKKTLDTLRTAGLKLNPTSALLEYR